MSLLISTCFVRVYQLGEKDYVLVTKEDTEDGDAVQFRFELMDGVETKVATAFKDEDRRDESFDTLTEDRVLKVVSSIREQFARESEK